METRDGVGGRYRVVPRIGATLAAGSRRRAGVAVLAVALLIMGGGIHLSQAT
jgi:hypothetical protein